MNESLLYEKTQHLLDDQGLLNGSDGEIEDLANKLLDFSNQYEISLNTFNIDSSLLEKIEKKTAGVQQDASPGSQEAEGLAACQGQLNASNVSVKDKMKGFLLTLAEWFGRLCAAIAGKEYIKAIITLLEKAQASVKQTWNSFFKTQEEGKEKTLENVVAFQ